MDPSTVIRRRVDNIRKSDCDPWNYRGLELSNGLLIVLVSHPTMDKAAVALDVTIGSMQDPDEVPGIAHFCEHMLFMGSEKYPGENEYDKLILSNGGQYNAYTSGDHTNYHYDINPSQLYESLDVFAQFFIAPLFNSNSTDRELLAVNSEYEGYVADDGWRILQLFKSTSDSKHPHSKFNIGTIETLKLIPKQLNIDVRQLLLKFHQTEYSANRMSLAVVGNQSLDDLQSTVVNIFKDIPNKNLSIQNYPNDPFGEEKRKTICYVLPVNDCRLLKMSWVVPDYRDIYYAEPITYLTYIIGYEGEGSVLSYLKKLGLITHLNVSEGQSSARGFSFFEIVIQLTPEGLERWKEVILHIYQYISMLKQEAPKEWIFQERKTLAAMKFQFDEKDQPLELVQHLASSMRDYPLDECLSGDYEMREFCPDLINDLLDNYLLPSKMRIFLIAQDFSSITTEKEKWFGTQYKLERLSDKLIQKCETYELNNELQFPQINNFVPTDFHLYYQSQQQNCDLKPLIPKNIKENEFYRLWFTQDNFYKLPKAFLCFDFRNPLADFDPIHENMNLMYCLLVDESLNESLYLAKKGGLAYDLSPSADGIQLIVCGYNQKLSTLLNKIIDKMINIQINQQQFDTYKELVRQSLQNLQCRVPYEQVDVQYLITEHVWAREELLSCIDGITVHDLELFIPRMLSRFYIEALMYGNLTKEQALDYMTNIQQQFHNKQYYQPLFPTMLVNHRSLILPEGCNYAYKQTNDAHQICAIEIYLQCFEQTLKNNAIMELFCHLVKESCGDQLRTKEQLGYVVFSGYERSDSGNSQGFYITIQSSLKLDYVNLRIETYIDSIREYITTMSDDIYCKQREGYIIKKLEISKSMSEQGILWFNEIVKHQYCFNRSQLQTDIIATLERQDLLKFYDHYIAPNSVHRRKLAVHVVPSPLVAAEIIQEPTTPTPVLTSPSIIASTPMSNGDAKIIRTLQRQQNIISPPITPSTPISKDDGTRIRTLQRQQSIMSPPITPSTPMSKDDGTRIRTLQRQLSITSKTIATPIEKLTVEPVICNLPIAKALDAPMNQTESTNEIMIENIMKNEKQLTLPETVWLENIPKWKSTLSCYPLAQSYANIDLPV